MAVVLADPWISITPSGLATWVDVNVSAYCPVGTTGVMIFMTTYATYPGGVVGFRKKGSTSDIRGWAYQQRVYFVGVDSSRIFQFWRGTFNADIYMAGYFTNDAVFFTDPVPYTVSLSGVYQTVTLSEIAEHAAGAILLVQVAGSTSYWIRRKGSNYDKYSSVVYGSQLHGAIYPVNSLKQIEVKVEQAANLQIWLVGFIKAGQIELKDNYIMKTDATFGAYADCEVASYIEGDPSKVSGVLMNVVSDTFYGMRKNGSTQGFYGTSAYDCNFHPLQFDANGLIEVRGGFTGFPVYVAGYFYSPPDPDDGTTDEGETRDLNIAFKNLSPDATLYLGLYLNPQPLGELHILGDMVEPSGGGYARKPLTRGSWTISGDHADYAQQAFSPSVGWGMVYGWFLATSPDNSGKLMNWQHFPSPYPCYAGATLKFNPRIVCA